MAERERVMFLSPTTVQTLIFNREKFRSADDAKRWARDHDFHDAKVDETEDSYRIRQRDPGEFANGSFRTISITDGIKAVIGRLKKSMSKADMEWEESRKDFLPDPGKELRFAVHKMNERTSFRLQTDKIDGWWGFAVDDLAAGREVDSDIVIKAVGPLWWLNIQRDNLDGLEVVDQGFWELSGEGRDSVVFDLRGDVYKGRYTIWRGLDGWRVSGPERAPYHIVKSSEEKRYTLGVAYPHGEIDAHGDTVSEETLETAAWSYMAASNGRRVGIMHQNGTDGSGIAVESYIYRGPDWTIGSQVVKAGDWLLGVVWPEDVWAEIKKGKFSGYSIQGWAVKS